MEIMHEELNCNDINKKFEELLRVCDYTPIEKLKWIQKQAEPKIFLNMFYDENDAYTLRNDSYCIAFEYCFWRNPHLLLKIDDDFYMYLKANGISTKEFLKKVKNCWNMEQFEKCSFWENKEIIHLDYLGYKKHTN